MMMFSTVAWRPACSRTPVASYMTMSEMTRHMAKSELLVPCSTATAVVSATMSAVWEEGMPPLPTSRCQSHTWAGEGEGRAAAAATASAGGMPWCSSSVSPIGSSTSGAAAASCAFASAASAASAALAFALLAPRPRPLAAVPAVLRVPVAAAARLLPVALLLVLAPPLREALRCASSCVAPSAASGSGCVCGASASAPSSSASSTGPDAMAAGGGAIGRVEMGRVVACAAVNRRRTPPYDGCCAASVAASAAADAAAAAAVPASSAAAAPFAAAPRPLRCGGGGARSSKTGGRLSKAHQHEGHTGFHSASGSPGQQPAAPDAQPAPRDEWALREERGVPFVTGGAFYRAESSAGRDLAVLAAALQRRRTGRLRVLDAMAGSGMRGARYLAQARTVCGIADADEVWVNDGSADLHAAMVFNLCSAAGLPAEEAGAGGDGSSSSCSGGIGGVSSSSDSGDADNGSRTFSSSVGGSGSSSGRPSGEQQPPDHPADKADAAASPRPAETPADGYECVSSSSSSSSSGPAGGQQDPGSDVRQRAAAWEARAQRVRLEGLARDVWQWQWQRGPQEQGQEAVGGSGAEGAAVEDAAACGRRIRVSHIDANRLLTNCYMRESYWDLIDVDSFGSESMHFPAAIDAVRYGGLLYLTSTDGFTSSGKRPERGLAAYGSYPRATPWANEQLLQQLEPILAAVDAAEGAR
ncbi:hypothetical protein TSOC_009125 [Tetrabaena socialis]|uniref:tRNA (Guanine(26)-N(2))-dimethyltransferase n=1 Tax=Tetrabaena socialis TaxID=47790 RepID=A0A2J7ZWR0_9CHLO|nr:hypothetical protein TSOC_009125 [Tetrabaena socialis]|eukprot:PNH04692.1 hypothetical protein TSOC_009125 [Tetrabaena socialis]